MKPQIKINKAIRLTKNKKHKQAIDLYSQTLNTPDITPKQTTVILHNQAISYDAQNNLPKALIAYTQIIKINLQDAYLAHYNRGVINAKQKNINAANFDFNNAINHPNATKKIKKDAIFNLKYINKTSTPPDQAKRP